MGRKTDALERIATALERIAAALERPPAAGVEAPAAPAPQSLRAEPAPAAAALSTRVEAAPGAAPPPAGALPGGEEAPAAPVAPPMGDRADVLRAYLERHQISIKKERAPAPIDETLLPIARLMGNHHATVKPVIDALKRANTTGGPYTIVLREQPPVVVTNCVQLAHQLHALALVEAFKYHKAPAYTLTLSPSRLPEAINFITGGWLELYVRGVVQRAVASARPGASHSLLENPQVSLPTGEDFELDLLLEVEGEVWWIEAKSGAYQKHIAKYKRVGRMLGLPAERCTLVLCEANAELCASLSGLFGMRVVGVADIAAALTEGMRARA
ncbi:MAG: hypothetical protein RL071_4384 [Pseudomonadota bacterium]|jgi:hypothetical protein